MDIIQILTAILIISASALCIALIYYVRVIVKSVQLLNSDLKELSAELKPLMQSTLILTDNLNQITSDAKEQFNTAKSIINDFRDRADSILNFESKVRGGLEDAIMPFVKNFNAVGKGVETFWRSFKNK
jgi:uncharacterized protein YoxC